MISKTNVSLFQNRSVPGRSYAPDLLPRLQAVLAILADIDFAHERSVEAIRNSHVDNDRQLDMLSFEKKRYQARRAPYSWELLLLQEQVAATFA